MQPYDLSRPQIARHVFRLLIRGAVTGGLAYGLLAGIDAKAAPWLLLVGAAVLALFAAGTTRSAHSLFFNPRLVLDRDGIELRYWRGTHSFLELLIPWLRCVDVTLPWSRFVGARTHEVYVGGVTSTVLNVETVDEVLSVDGHVFALSVDDLMSGILSFREVQRQLPLRAASQFEDFQRARFIEPVRMVAGFDQSEAKLTGCLSALMIALALYFIGGAYSRGDTTLASVAGISLFILIVAMIVYVRALDTVYTNIIECRSEGLALGRVDGKLRLIPWADVLSSRLTEITYQVENRRPSSSAQLELNLNGTGPVRVNSTHDRSPTQIQELVMPPLEKVCAVRHLMSEKHLDMQAAAAAVGLTFPSAVVPATSAATPNGR